MQVNVMRFETTGSALAFALILSATLAGCKSAATPASGAVAVPESKIVSTVETAGAGSLAGVAQDAIQSWLGQHPDVTKQIAADCKMAYEKRDAKWQDTTEGRVCMADANVLMMTPHTLFVGHGGTGTWKTPAKKSANQ